MLKHYKEKLDDKFAEAKAKNYISVIKSQLNRVNSLIYADSYHLVGMDQYRKFNRIF